MDSTVSGNRATGLERSCGARGIGPRDTADHRTRPGDWMRSRDLAPGLQALRAWFGGHGYDTHRHDTYGISVTDAGLQVFDYRGARRVSAAGNVTVLHPDEAHDGRAGTMDGFGYRIVYVAPSLIAEAVHAIRGRPSALPFAREPVMTNATLAGAVADAFADVPRGITDRYHPEPLALDVIVLHLAEGLLGLDPSCRGDGTRVRVDHAAMERARALLDAETSRVVRSSELEAITGVTRYDLARQFRAAFATSPYRYSVMRRLDHARIEMTRNRSLADVALGAGFADQAHLSRMFRAAFGITPARYRALGRIPAPRGARQ